MGSTQAVVVPVLTCVFAAWLYPPRNAVPAELVSKGYVQPGKSEGWLNLFNNIVNP